MNNALTRFTSYFARKRTSKYAAVLLGLFAGFGFISSANAASTGMVQVTCTNGTFETGWDNSNQYFRDRGNIAALYCQIVHNSGYVSDNLTDDSLRYYNGVVPVIVQPVVDTPTAIVETHTPQVVETLTVPSIPDSQTVVSDTGTPVQADSSTPTVDSPTVIVDSPTVVVETPTVVETLTPVESTTPVVDTGTAPIETLPLPTPPPAVEPQPVPVPVVVPQPEPQPQPEPVVPVVESPVEQEIPSETEVVQEDPVIETPVVEEPVVEEPVPVEDSEQVPVEEVQPDAQTEEEQNELTPEPSPEPVVEPEPASQPDIAPEPPVSPQIVEASSVDLSTLAPSTPVLLDNGVVLTAEVVVALQLLENPAELLTELFSDPGQVLTAVSNIGADMSPEVREKSEKVVVSAIIAGGVAVQAASIAASATYRRNP